MDVAISAAKNSQFVKDTIGESAFFKYITYKENEATKSSDPNDENSFTKENYFAII